MQTLEMKNKYLIWCRERNKGILDPPGPRPIPAQNQGCGPSDLDASPAGDEFDRFFATCIPNDDGNGFRDPSCSPAELAMLATPFPNRGDREILAKVPGGWTAESWAERLRYMAGACGDVNPDKSGKYAEQAETFEGALHG